MNLNQGQSQTMPSVLSGAPTPAQEPVAVVLEHALKQSDVALNHIEAILQHVGGAPTAQADEPCTPGVMGKAFALRTQLQKINGKLESLVALL